jgi:sulfur-oxidizing protein SoxB
MDMTATTPVRYGQPMSGEMIKTVLEDVCDNLFNPDPYYQQGGDMVRVGGLEYSCNPLAPMGKRIEDMRLNGKPIESSRQYKVAGWAPVAEEASKAGNKPVWELRAVAQVKGGTSARKVNVPSSPARAGPGFGAGGT